MAADPTHDTPTPRPGPSSNAGALARLQRTLTAALLVVSLSWLIGWWHVSTTTAIVGCAAIALGHIWVLGCECAAAAMVNRRAEPTPTSPPSPGFPRWLRAWATECSMTPGVFYWRQPFRSQAVPDYLPSQATGRRGVVLVHGFVCNRGFWTPWLKQLVQAGHPFMAVNLEPVVASIDDYVPTLEQAVQQVTQATGKPPLLVCHSMGGLVARAWLRQAGPEATMRVAHIVTIATPHHGTWLGNRSRQRNGRQMACGNEWLETLRASEPAERYQRFTCWHSNCDNIVFPAANATLAGADNRFVPGMPHVALAFRPEVMRETLTWLN